MLFTAAASVLMILGNSRSSKKYKFKQLHVYRNDDTILRGVAVMAIPVILMMGCVVVINGHLSAGGGFAGGAILSTALILCANAYGFESVRRYSSCQVLRR